MCSGRDGVGGVWGGRGQGGVGSFLSGEKKEGEWLGGGCVGLRGD